jgi:hypothetical protein
MRTPSYSTLPVLLMSSLGVAVAPAAGQPEAPGGTAEASPPRSEFRAEAAPAASTAAEAIRREAELRRRVDELTAEVNRLRAENDLLRGSLGQRRIDAYVVPPQPQPGNKPVLPDGRPVPPNWIPRNGDLWHYIVPLSDQPAGVRANAKSR